MNSSLWSAGNSSDDASLLFYHRVKYGIGVWLCLTSIIGCPANLFAARCAWKFARSRNPSLLYQWFVFSMSMADFLFLAIISPIQFSQYSFRARLARGPCLAFYVISHSTTVASSLSLLALNVDKFLAIYRPLYHVSTLSGRRVFLAITASWLVSVAWALFFVFGPMTIHEGWCLLKVTSYTYYLGFALVFFVAPTATATVLSICIAIVVKRQLGSASFSGRRKSASVHEEYKMESTGEVRRSSRNLINAAAVHRDSLSRARKITFVFTTTIFSCLTVLPYRIVFSVMSTPSKRSQGGWMIVFALVCFSLMAANPVGNAMITIFTQRRFRQELRRVWEKVRKLVCGRYAKNRNGGEGVNLDSDQRTRNTVCIPLLK